MAIDQVDQSVVTQEPTGPRANRPCGRIAVIPPRAAPSGSEMTRRIVILVFGLIQVVIGARFVLLLLDAREANALVSGILNISQLFVAPFEGILRTDSLHAGGSSSTSPRSSRSSAGRSSS